MARIEIRREITLNDIALAEQAAAMAIAWYKDQAKGKPRTAFTRERIAALRALIKKLSGISDAFDLATGDDPENAPDLGADRVTLIWALESGVR